ncbi:MAG: cytochrome c [Vicinamibacterales bacterium]|nr:cytochrome c [Vicinamibacterales bacterium]
MRRHHVAAAVLLGAAFVLVGPLSAASDPPGIKWVPAKQLDSHAGAVVYEAYCAVCHGPAGRGDGKAARHLSVPVPDLTTIAARDGQFRVLHVRSHILDRSEHMIMPDWERVLLANFGRDRGLVELCTNNLARHIRTLQAQAASR